MIELPIFKFQNSIMALHLSNSIEYLQLTREILFLTLCPQSLKLPMIVSDLFMVIIIHFDSEFILIKDKKTKIFWVQRWWGLNEYKDVADIWMKLWMMGFCTWTEPPWSWYISTYLLRKYSSRLNKNYQRNFPLNSIFDRFNTSFKKIWWQSSKHT